jgi:hypothetical protein
MPKDNKLRWLRDNFGDGQVGMSGWYLWIETANPLQPVSLTVGCMPVMFIRRRRVLGNYSTVLYPNPRVPDPCPALQWPIMTFPTTSCVSVYYDLWNIRRATSHYFQIVLQIKEQSKKQNSS